MEALKKTSEQLKKEYLDERKAKDWRCNNRCVKSIYTLIDQEQLSKMEQKSKDLKSNAGKQKFLKQQTFRFADPDKVKKRHEAQKKYEEEFERDLKKRMKRIKVASAQIIKKHGKVRTNSKPNSNHSSMAMLAAEKSKQMAEADAMISEAGGISPRNKSSAKTGPSDHLKALQVRLQKEALKFETNLDLLFIRRMREEGALIHSHKDWEINLMYKHEQDKHFAKIEQNKNPRAIK